jgi:hypothetical protein
MDFLSGASGILLRKLILPQKDLTDVIIDTDLTSQTNVYSWSCLR